MLYDDKSIVTYIFEIGTCIFGIVQFIFITLKTLELINWKWGWVLSPVIIYSWLFLLGFISYLIIQKLNEWM